MMMEANEKKAGYCVYCGKRLKRLSTKGKDWQYRRVHAKCCFAWKALKQPILYDFTTGTSVNYKIGSSKASSKM